MNTYTKHVILRRWVTGAILLVSMFAFDTFAQDVTAVAVPESAPTTIIDAMGELATGINTVWMLLAAMLVFFMQPGFALVEAGFTRTKNTANILMKNFVDFMFGSLLFWSSDSD